MNDITNIDRPLPPLSQNKLISIIAIKLEQQQKKNWPLNNKQHTKELILT